MIGYKATDKDGRCRDFLFEVGKTYRKDTKKENFKNEIATCGGFLKTLEYKDAFKKAYEKTDDEEKKQLFELPNFDCAIFEEISGIDTREDFKRIKGDKE